MTDDTFLKLIDESRKAGERSGLRQAIGVIQAYLAVLNDPETSKGFDHVEARKDQLERVLKTLIESQ